MIKKCGFCCRSCILKDWNLRWCFFLWRLCILNKGKIGYEGRIAEIPATRSYWPWVYQQIYQPLISIAFALVSLIPSDHFALAWKIQSETEPLPICLVLQFSFPHSRSKEFIYIHYFTFCWVNFFHDPLPWGLCFLLSTRTALCKLPYYFFLAKFKVTAQFCFTHVLSQHCECLLFRYLAGLPHLLF